MSETSAYVDAPYLGISQAPPQVRLGGSCEDMLNCTTFIPQGVQQRPPMEVAQHIAGVNPTAGFAAWSIPRGTPSQELEAHFNREGSATVLRLYHATDFTSPSLTVTAAAQTYLNTATVPYEDLRLATVEDVTFISSKKVTVAANGDTAATLPFSAIIWIKTGGYGRMYSATVSQGGSTVNATFKPSTGGNATDALGVGTDVIARGLYDGTVPATSNAVAGGTPLGAALTAIGFTVTRVGPCIFLTSPTDFTLTVTDDQGSVAGVGIKSAVQRITDLPAAAFNGFTIRVNNGEVGGNSDCYFKYVLTTGVAGTWQECIAPGSLLGLNPATMPIGITANLDGTYTCDVLPWTRRTVGDPTLSPDPDVVGDVIVGLSWWIGRLVMLTAGGLQLSASDSPYKLYTTTLTTDEKSDAVGYLPPSTGKAPFQELCKFSDRVVAFGSNTQAMLANQSFGAPTIDNIQFKDLAFSEFNPAIRPQPGKNKVYFAGVRSSFGLVVELGTDRVSGEQVPEEMTKAVPRLLPAGINRAATRPDSYLTVYGQDGTTALYQHVYQFEQNQRVQNSWSPWQLPLGHVLRDIRFVQTRLRIYTVCASTLWVLDMELAQDYLDGIHRHYLDLRSGSGYCSPTFDGTNTTLTLPQANGDTTNALATVAVGTPNYPEGYTPNVVSRSATQLVLSGDWTAVSMWVGYQYPAYFVPTRIFAVGQDGKVMHKGRLTLSRLRIDASKTSQLQVLVAIQGRDTKTVSYEGFFPDSSLLNSPSGQKTDIAIPVAVGGKNTDTSFTIQASGPLGFKISGFEWFGKFTQDAGRRT